MTVTPPDDVAPDEDDADEQDPDVGTPDESEEPTPFTGDPSHG